MKAAVLTSVLAFAVALPDKVLAQAEDESLDDLQREAAEARAAPEAARGEGGFPAVWAALPAALHAEAEYAAARAEDAARRGDIEATKAAAANAEDSLQGARNVVSDAEYYNEANTLAAAEAEAAARRASAAVEAEAARAGAPEAAALVEQGPGRRRACHRRLPSYRTRRRARRACGPRSATRS